MELTGTTAIVTGGARGIGRTLVLALADAGADVAIADVDEVAAQDAVREVELKGRKAIAVPVDVSNASSVHAMVAAVQEALGHPNILVNNAGIFPITPVSQITEEVWERVMDINLKGTFLCAQAVLEPMRKAGWGRIINIASVAGLVGAVGMAHYAASKAGVIGLTKALARELAPLGITVNAVAPGIVETETTWRTFPKSALEMYVTQVPMRRLARPEDLTGIVVLLASRASEYITGQVFAVDGGYTMQ